MKFTLKMMSIMVRKDACLAGQGSNPLVQDMTTYKYNSRYYLVQGLANLTVD
jgi:hypothetical protein